MDNCLNSLHHRTAFITGGADGIGAATVEYFLQYGANVVFIDTNEEKAHQLMKKLNSEYVAFFKADVSNKTDMKEAVEFAIDRFGSINIVFANAGIYFSGDILSTAEEDWDRIILNNLKGTYITLKETIPVLIENGKGSVILMGSDQSFVGKKESFVYGATKGAIAQMTKSLALDYADKNIRVNCVCPGTIDTTLSRNAIENIAQKRYANDIDKVMQIENEAQPLGRIGQAEEVARLVAFLASDDASFMTGALVPIDGGYTAC